MVWPIPYACAQPYHPDSGSHVMDSRFALLGVHQHVIASTVSFTDHRPSFLLPRRMHKHPIKRQLHTTHVVAVGWELKSSSPTACVWRWDLMSPKKGETALHGCHYLGDVVVRMSTVLAIPRSWYVCFIAYLEE